MADPKPYQGITLTPLGTSQRQRKSGSRTSNHTSLINFDSEREGSEKTKLDTIDTGDSKVILSAEINREDSGDEPHFSNSQLNMYLRCSKQYEFRYVKGLKVPPSLNMQSGKALHSVLETNSIYKIAKKEDMPIEAILDLTATEHDNAMIDVDEVKKKIGKDKDDSLAIAGHFRRIEAPRIQPITAEYGFKIILDGDEYESEYLPVIGFIDSISQQPDPRDGPTKGQQVVGMEDYKKVGRRKSQLEVDISTQLTLYDYVYTLNVGQPPDVIGMRLLGNDGPRAQKPGPYAQLMPRSQKYMERQARKHRQDRIIDQIKRVQRAIKQAVFIPTDDASNCSWCGYRDICQDKPS